MNGSTRKHGWAGQQNKVRLEAKDGGGKLEEVGDCRDREHFVF
jgi:hypothetical protein